MTEVMPSVPTIPPPPPSAFMLLRDKTVGQLLANAPFPQEFDCSRIVSWGQQIQMYDLQISVPMLTWILAEAGHTGNHASCIIC